MGNPFNPPNPPKPPPLPDYAAMEAEAKLKAADEAREKKRKKVGRRGTILAGELTESPNAPPKTLLGQ
jgi:hypothetical protein